MDNRDLQRDGGSPESGRLEALHASGRCPGRPSRPLVQETQGSSPPLSVYGARIDRSGNRVCMGPARISSIICVCQMQKEVPRRNCIRDAAVPKNVCLRDGTFCAFEVVPSTDDVAWMSGVMYKTALLFNVMLTLDVG